MSLPGFDEQASTYDVRFTRSVLGAIYREAVWRTVSRVFQPGMSVLDLGCGTGEDALQLGRLGCEVVAIDSSEAMIEVAVAKSEAASATVDFRCLDIESVTEIDTPARFDGLLSNFGALNCVADLGCVVSDMMLLLKPGAVAVICMLGRYVPVEWLQFLLRGDPKRAFRRLRPGGQLWRDVRVFYPTVARVRSAFESGFDIRRVSGVGVLLPTGDAEAWALRNPRIVRSLGRLERGLESVFPFPYLGDHFVLEMVRS